MSNLLAFLILATAALLEAGGDAIVRGGPHAHPGLSVFRSAKLARQSLR